MLETLFRVCPKCKEQKPLSGFNRSKRRSNGHCYRCRVCDHKHRSEWGKENPDRRRVHQRKVVFGISGSEWDFLFQAQGRRCAICQSTTTGSKRSWHTDHDEATGKVRGILCHYCNIGIGVLKHDREILTAAIKYLEHGGWLFGKGAK
jgi:hypothetical protein